MIIAAVSGQTYAEYMDDNVFDQLGLAQRLQYVGVLGQPIHVEGVTDMDTLPRKCRSSRVSAIGETEIVGSQTGD